MEAGIFIAVIFQVPPDGKSTVLHEM